MAKAKRGRPRKEPSRTFPIRMPKRLLTLVQGEARNRDMSVTAVIVERLEDAFAEVPSYEAHIGDLQTMLDCVIRAYLPMTDKDGVPLVEWWTSRFAIEAIVLAFADVVRAIGPTGNPDPPELVGREDELLSLEAQSFKTPEARALVMAQFALNEYRTAERLDARVRRMAVDDIPVYGKALYLTVARRDRLVSMKKRWPSRSATTPPTAKNRSKK